MSERINISLSEFGSFVEGELGAGREIEITVTGNSMYPLFRDKRDLVRLQPVKKLKKKKICFYKRNDGRYILHRIIKIKKNKIYCVGDNQTVIEGPLDKTQFLGEVISFTRRGKVSTTRALWYKFYTFIWCISVKRRPKLLKFLLKFACLGKK